MTGRESDMRCPSCGGTTFEVVRPGTLRCVTERVVNAVPPGQGGNFGVQPIPIYGPCQSVAPEQAWRETALRLKREEAERRSRTRASEQAAIALKEQAERLERRRVELLVELERRGNPGIQRRLVPGRRHLSIIAKIFGRVGTDMPVEAESAWPIGTFTWWQTMSHGVEQYENLETGYTPTGRLVPMDFATSGDPVHVLYGRRKLAGGPYRPQSRDKVELRQPANGDIVRALENALPQPDP